MRNDTDGDSVLDKEKVPFSFAERKYREMLALGDSLLPTERRQPAMKHYALVFQ